MSDIDVTKILKWAGFKYIDQQDDELWYFRSAPTYEPSIEMYGSRWITPDGTGAYAELPDIRNSMDACMEYLEPVLFEKGYRYVLRREKVGHLMKIVKLPSGFWSDLDLVDIEIDDKPAMAFSRAVEKLIDLEEKNDAK